MATVSISLGPPLAVNRSRAEAAEDPETVRKAQAKHVIFTDYIACCFFSHAGVLNLSLGDQGGV